MAERARAFVEGRARTSVVAPGPDRAREVAVAATFAPIAAELRAAYPSLFAHAAAILADPDRPAGVQHRPFRPTGFVRAECGWCGDWFARYARGRKVGQRCCSPGCSAEYRRWLRRRALRS